MSRSALHLSESEAIDLGVRARSRPSLIDMRDNPAERVKRGQKYGNTKVKDGDRTFDSKAEHRRWQYLVALEKAREIRNLQCQVRFELIPALDNRRLITREEAKRMFPDQAEGGDATIRVATLTGEGADDGRQE